MMRMMSYDRAANERNAVSALRMAGQPLSWFRLDDGVMGGQSETNHLVSEDDGALHFVGTINTNGGGFASVRSKIPAGVLASSTTDAIRIRFRGDGKTYKFIMSDGNRMAGAPMSRTPSWQTDLPTRRDGGGAAEWEEATIPVASFLPNFGGSSRSPEADKANYVLDVSEIREIGLMLSLKLADGRPNPRETYGEGVFPFELLVKSIEPVPHN